MIVQGKTYASQFSDKSIANHLMQIYTELTGLK